MLPTNAAAMDDEELEIVYESFAPTCSSSAEKNFTAGNSISRDVSGTSTTKLQGISINEAHKIKSDTKVYVKDRLKILKNKSSDLNCEKKVEVYQSQLNLRVVKNAKKTENSEVAFGKNSDAKTHFSTPVKDKEVNEVTSTPQSSKSLSEQLNIKVSPQLVRRPNKFSLNGSPASSKKNNKYFSNGRNTSVKSIHHTSPLTFMRSNIAGKGSPVERFSLPNTKGVKRKLNFSSNFTLSSSGSENDTLSSVKVSPSGESQSTTSTIFDSEIPNSYDGRYILRQLERHISVVLEDSSSICLINEEEMNMIHSFSSMSSDCRDLYARLHHRKYKWNRLSDIQYDTATAENLDVLKENGFFSTDTEDVSIECLLELLKLTEVKKLCKTLGMKRAAQNKKKCLEEILEFSQNQRTISSEMQIGSSENVIRRKLKNLLGPCFILCPEPRGLFRRMHLLFNLKFSRNENSAYGSQDLFDIQFMGTEKMLYPNYTIDKTTKIFSCRDELLRYQIAEDLRMEFLSRMGAKDWVKADAILDTIRDGFINELYTESMDVSADELPLSVRKFTPGSIYAHALNQGIEVLKKLKKKDEAINILMLLLDQKTYLPYMRGRWYEKIITIRRTAGQLKEVAKIISDGMKDENIDDQCRYIMSCRCREILKKKKGDLLEVKSDLRKIPLFPPLESVEPIEIKASALDGKAGYRRVWVQDDETGHGKTYSSVEELAKSHYCPTFYQKGIHAENSIVSSLFGILFWDIIYGCNVPCAFISPYQTRPLDLSTGEFYINRQSAIDSKLSEMAKWTADELCSWVKNVYNEQNGISSVVHWSWFRSADSLVEIIDCIGLEVILKICERYAKKYRGVRGGFPDLFLWSPGHKNQYKFVEVKGPNDTLGTNQKLWLDFLVKINANVEVCLVAANGSKTVKPRSVQPEENCDADQQDKIEVHEDDSALRN